MGDSPSHRDAESQRLWRLAGMGGTLASEILAGVVIGWGLDALFGTAPTMIVIFTTGGVLIGMITFVRSARKAMAMDQARWRAQRDEKEPESGQSLTAPPTTDESCGRSTETPHS